MTLTDDCAYCGQAIEFRDRSQRNRNTWWESTSTGSSVCPASHTRDRTHVPVKMIRTSLGLDPMPAPPVKARRRSDAARQVFGG